ncbi:MAG: Asp-tRNA(Asn)/Glu-tRNA(Gln) amidotransferase subunit GatA [Deltaproteobacteria bacterium]|nr:Asp-tRNA(Asn)/Glu-tRNA(Gln) amidotransferase subunit GatA [Deltaproteobacteria bacterium]
MDPSFLTVHEVHDRLRSRELSAVELTQALFDRIEATDGAIGAYLAVCREQGMEDARRADAKLAAGDPDSKLLGIPVALKDVLLTEGVPTTCASKILDGFTPPYDGTAVRRLKEAGAVVLGKTNMDEFAMGSSTENSGYSITRNPWNPDHVPGGSSGGSAAAVAAGQCIAALGTDTGGSIRQPASFCGIVGLKPTYGRVSRYGVVAYASSLDQVGPMTRDVTDCALVLQAVAGHDPADSTSVDVPVPDYAAALTGDVKGLKIGVPKEYFAAGLQPEVEQAVRRGIDELEKAGALVTEVSLPRNDYAVAAYYIIAAAEASSNLARYDGMRYGPRVQAEDLTSTYMKSRAQGFGHEVKRRIMLGTYVLSAGYYDAYYLKAQKVRTLLKQDMESALGECDAIVAPTCPTTAFKLEEMTHDPLQMYLSDILTISVNLAGLPALSVPCGFDDAGLPIGMQIIGRHFDEATVLRLGYAYEQATEWRTLRPEI